MYVEEARGDLGRCQGPRGGAGGAGPLAYHHAGDASNKLPVWASGHY